MSSCCVQNRKSSFLCKQRSQCIQSHELSSLYIVSQRRQFSNSDPSQYLLWNDHFAQDSKKDKKQSLSLLPPLLILSQPTGVQGSARRAVEGHLVKQCPHSSLHLCSRKCVWSGPEITTRGFCWLTCFHTHSLQFGLKGTCKATRNTTKQLFGNPGKIKAKSESTKRPILLTK